MIHTNLELIVTCSHIVESNGIDTFLTLFHVAIGVPVTNQGSHHAISMLHRSCLTGLHGGHIDFLSLGIERNGYGIDTCLLHAEGIVIIWISHGPGMILHHLELIACTLLQSHIRLHQGIEITLQGHVVGSILRIP